MMRTITRAEAKYLMVKAIGSRLAMFAEQGEYLTDESRSELRRFATGPAQSIRLVVNESDHPHESKRAVTISLTTRSRHGAALMWRVKVELSVWASTQDGSREAVRGWGVAQSLAVAALKAADAMPAIVDHVGAELVSA